MVTFAWIVLFLLLFGSLAYMQAALSIWTLAAFIFMALLTGFSNLHMATLILSWLILAAVTISLNFTWIRRQLFTRHIFTAFRNAVPTMSQTERDALEAGTVSFEAELFQGRPDWKKWHAQPVYKLTVAEQAFLDGPVAELCAMIDDWDISHNRLDLPPQMWQFIANKGFFGLIIPKEYGGLEFSATAHAKILETISSKSLSVAVIVSVPNSLGPAELLLEYGTQSQRDHYLPRLATGEDVPCFALTSPDAGSDAGAMPDYGVVCKGQHDGQEVLGIRLNFNKRYITLAPVATVVGLAFKLFDPEQLLGQQRQIGITCALIPANHFGVEIGRRHFPLNASFPNGPVRGENVFIPLAWIIGGAEMAGHGWRMLVECLSAGRAISLPSSALGGAKLATYATGAYARIRKQFNVPIGQFEGVEEALTRIGSYTYLLNAACTVTHSIIDAGAKPSVLSAILKFHATERARMIVNDAMDVHGGKGICLGPNNYLGRFYQASPISITVEGANILTRSMIIFGQGAVRCHPYALAEIEAMNHIDPVEGLKQFDKALFAHMGYVFSNISRALVVGLTGGLFLRVPAGSCKRFYRRFTRMSVAFALFSDLAMLTLGGKLKRKEKISARFGDILSYLYLGATVLRQFEQQGSPELDLPVVNWVCKDLLLNCQNTFHGLLVNFPNRILAKLLRFIIFPLGKRYSAASDRDGHEVAACLLEPSETRSRVCQGVYDVVDGKNSLGKLADTLQKVIEAEHIEKRLQHAIKDAKLSGYTYEEHIASALSQNILSAAEAEQLCDLRRARSDVINVDDFSLEELLAHGRHRIEEQRNNAQEEG